MDMIIYLLKGALKILLVMVGGAMLFGGGICVAADTVFLVTSGNLFIFIWLGVAALVALVGWGCIKWATKINNPSAQIKTPEDKP